jgi:uncharacterized Fe-S cluster-containing radical SAM superfamily enzyme
MAAQVISSINDAEIPAILKAAADHGAGKCRIYCCKAE